MEGEALDRRPCLAPLSDELPVGAETRPLDQAAADRLLLLVVNEGCVDARRLCPVRLVDGQDAAALGVVFGCSGAGRRSARRSRIHVSTSKAC